MIADGVGRPQVSAAVSGIEFVVEMDEIVPLIVNSVHHLVDHRRVVDVDAVPTFLEMNLSLPNRHLNRPPGGGWYRLKTMCNERNFHVASPVERMLLRSRSDGQ